MTAKSLNVSGLFEHMGMPCSRMLKVMDVLGFTEIPQQLIVKRWARDAGDILPAHLQIYQRDHAGSRSITHHHTTLYVHAMELVCLGDACVESYQRGMQIIKDGLFHCLNLMEEETALIWRTTPAVIWRTTPFMSSVKTLGEALTEIMDYTMTHWQVWVPRRRSERLDDQQIVVRKHHTRS